MSKVFIKSDLSETAQLLLKSLEVDFDLIDGKNTDYILKQLMEEINSLEEKNHKSFDKERYSKINQLMIIVNSIENPIKIEKRNK